MSWRDPGREDKGPTGAWQGVITVHTWLSKPSHFQDLQTSVSLLHAGPWTITTSLAARGCFSSQSTGTQEHCLRLRLCPLDLTAPSAPKLPPRQGTAISECWVAAGAWLGGHRFGSFLILGVRHCPPKPLKRAFHFGFFFFSKPLQYPQLKYFFFARITEIMATSLLLLWFNPSLQPSPTEPLTHPCYSRMEERELHW